MTQLSQGFCLDLADTLAGHGKMLSDLFERVLRAGVAEAKPHLDHLFLTRRQRRENFIGDLTQIREGDRFGRVQDRFVLDKIAEMRIFLFADRRFERDRFLSDLEDLSDLRHRNVHSLRDLFRRRFAAKLLYQQTRGADQLVDRLDHVDRDADRPRLVGDGTRDRLPDPPCRVGRELITTPPFELVDRLHQTDVAFLDKVEELQAAVGVFLGDRNNQPKVGLDQFTFCLVGLGLADADRLVTNA